MRFFFQRWYSGRTPSLMRIPGAKIARQPRRAPRIRWSGRTRTPRKTAKLKRGPGRAWMIANPRRKSRGVTLEEG